MVDSSEMKRSIGVDVELHCKGFVASSCPLNERANSYMKQVNERLLTSGESDKFTEFISLLREFRFRRIDAASLEVKIRKLLDGHDDLILQFINNFLPDLCYDDDDVDDNDFDEDSENTTQTDPPVKFLKVVDFVNKVKTRFRDNKDVYKAFLEIMNQIRDRCSLEKRYDEIEALFADQRDLLEEFDSIVSDSSADGWRMRLSKQGIDFCEKANSVLCSSDYQALLKVLHGYGAGELDRDGMKARVSDLLKDKCGGLCFREFNDFCRSCESSSIKDNAVASLSNESSNREQKHVIITVPSHELDLSKCKRVSPSYWVLPENHSRPLAGQRSRIGDEVLNDKLVCVSARGGDFSCKKRQRMQLEKYRDDCDDKRHEMDTLGGNITSASERIGKLLKKINKNEIDPNLIKIEDHLSVINLRCIERVYGEQGLELMELFHANPVFTLPLMLRRLTQKKQELKEYLQQFNKDCAWGYAELQLEFEDKQHESRKNGEDEQSMVPSIEEDS